MLSHENLDHDDQRRAAAELVAKLRAWALGEPRDTEALRERFSPEAIRRVAKGFKPCASSDRIAAAAIAALPDLLLQELAEVMVLKGKEEQGAMALAGNL